MDGDPLEGGMKLTFDGFKIMQTNGNCIAEVKTKIEDIKSTWDGNDYTDKLQGIKSLSSKKKEEHKDFVFHLSNDVTYTRFEQFKNSESRHRMDELMVLQQNKASDEERLHRLRLQYSKVSEVQRKSLAGEILRLEKKVDAYPDDIERVENAIRRLELK